MTCLKIQSMWVANPDDDEQGLLVMADHRLVAVLTRLGSSHGTLDGRWFLEAGFGPCAVTQPEPFVTSIEALQWVLYHADDDRPPSSSEIAEMERAIRVFDRVPETSLRLVKR